MICIFADGRIVYDKSILTTEDEGKYVEVKSLPQIPLKEGKAGVITGCNLETGEIKIEYFDAIKEPEPPEPQPTPPTEAELIQAEILLMQQAIVAKQKEQDNVLALLLLNQQKG